MGQLFEKLYAKYERQVREHQAKGEWTDHSLAHVLHAKLIRTQIEILGGDYCDYWYVGDKGEAAKAYSNLEEI